MREAVRPDLHLGRHRPPGPAATGRREHRDGRDWVVYDRRLRATVAQVWDALVDREEVAQWVGSPRRNAPDDPDHFCFTLEAEGVPSPDFRLDELEPARRIAISMGDSGNYDAWRLVIELGTEDDGTTIVLTQSVANPALAPSVAAGCEFYLDRLRAHLEGADVHELEYDEYFVGQAAHYRKLFPVQRRGQPPLHP